MPVDPPAGKRNLDRVESIVRDVCGDGAGLRLCLGQKSCWSPDMSHRQCSAHSPFRQEDASDWREQHRQSPQVAVRGEVDSPWDVSAAPVVTRLLSVRKGQTRPGT
jgi:hypothetical protein